MARFHGNTVVQEILCILRFVFNVKLGDEWPHTLRIHGDVNMGCAAGVRYGFDSKETVTPRTVGQRVAKSLKTRVNGVRTRVSWMPVAAVHITLPDFDTHPSQRVAAAIQKVAGQIREMAFRGQIPSRHMYQIVIVIQGQLRRIERSCGLARCQQSCMHHTRRWRGQREPRQSLQCLSSLAMHSSSPLWKIPGIT